MTEFLTTYGLWLVIALLIVIAITYLMSSKASADKAQTEDGAEPSKAVEPQVESAPPPVVTPTPVPPVIDPIPAAAPPPSVQIDPTPARPAPEPAPAPAASTDGVDNLLQLKGVGPKLAALLTDLGVTRFAQIAAWTDADLAAIDAKLGNFKGRPVRDQWIDQAKYLAAGDVAGFEAKYGKL
ncbi:hypothetical protein [Sphingobium algorifonticola]|uniref:LSU ribosomal protein L21p n=1 Tax=Sphingobium algorifonticola TaxID=2008318 RepID=A0A437J8U5_9SPHN|nr:hypothetical protein [Sphingobium algorifonticola]RVT41916.1 hypothetical protein ENE74_06555 [Sphingobium algorifonticola]